MRKLLRLIAYFVVAIVFATGAFFVGMRFHDGPLEIISGGPFRSGELSGTPASWDFLKERQQIEFQTLDPETSRTVWLGVFDGRLFLVSGYMNTGYGGLWKQWPHYLEDDDRIILRVDGKLYPQRLERIMGGEIVPSVLSEFDREYAVGSASDDAPITSGDTWMFEVVPR
jgi:hypothetical protein